MSQIGKQIDGMSPSYTKRMAQEAISEVKAENLGWIAADIGGGRGELSNSIASKFQSVFILDYAPPAKEDLPLNVQPMQVDLNNTWPLENESIDFALSCEVIEHVENPRHFLREMLRVTRPGGFIFITTPNNHSFFSKLNFLFRDQHRYFQDSCYPAHITPLLKSDFDRFALELGIKRIRWLWSAEDRIPVLNWKLPWANQASSESIGVLYQTPPN